MRGDGTTCNTSNWTGGLLFDSSAGSSIRPIFTIAAVARDTYNNLWVYFGTGDKNDPTAPNAQEKFVALKDNDRTTTYTYGNLENITSSGSTYSGTGDGWYINMTGQGEKILADPAVFGGVVYFTTYTPPTGNDPCAQGGTAKLYGVDYTTGAGEISTSGRPQHDHRDRDRIGAHRFHAAGEHDHAGPLRHDQRGWRYRG